MKPRGFTLIELMIVVAIVGVLSAIALPLYKDYVLKGRWGSNLTDLESVKTAIRGCMQDRLNDGAQCDTPAELRSHGFSGTIFVTPRYANSAIVVAGAAGYVDISFTGSAESGGYTYAARCQPDISGLFACTAISGTDTIPSNYLETAAR